MARQPPLIAGNWKMNLNHLEAIALVQKLAFALPEKYYERVEVAVLPPFTDIRSVQTLIDGDRLKMVLRRAGPVAARVRRLHRRRVGRDARQARLPLRPRRALGAPGAPRGGRRRWSTARCTRPSRTASCRSCASARGCRCGEAGRHVEHTTAQLLAGLEKVSSEHAQTLVVAYEPVWAIGTGRVASAADAQEVCAAIRQALAGKYGETIAAGIRVLYGGSVKPSNVGEIVAQTDVDGALVGGASLDADGFAQLCAIAAGGPLP